MNAIVMGMLADLLEIQEDHLKREQDEYDRAKDLVRITTRMREERIAKIEAIREALANAGTD